MRGRLAGWAITLGLCTGLLIHTLLVASGVSVIFQASYFAFTSLKLAGGAYLLYLAFLAFQASAKKFSPTENGGASLIQLYQRGIIMNITNPKVSIFFLSFLPQFADPSRGSIMLQFVIFGFVFIISALLVFGLISLFAGYLKDRLKRSQWVQTILHRISGTIYVALAVKLVTAEM